MPRRELSRDPSHRSATRGPPFPASRSSRRHHSPSRWRGTRGRSHDSRPFGSSKLSQTRSGREHPRSLSSLRHLSRRSRSRSPLPAERASAQTPPSHGSSNLNRVLYSIHRLADAIDRRDSASVNHERNRAQQSDTWWNRRDTSDRSSSSNTTAALNNGKTVVELRTRIVASAQCPSRLDVVPTRNELLTTLPSCLKNYQNHAADVQSEYQLPGDKFVNGRCITQVHDQSPIRFQALIDLLGK